MSDILILGIVYSTGQTMLPGLPVRDSNEPWPSATQAAYGIINQSFVTISQILLQEDPDPLRLNYHASVLINDTLPLLQALERNSAAPLPHDWLDSCAEALGKLVVDVLKSAEHTTGKYIVDC